MKKLTALVFTIVTIMGIMTGCSKTPTVKSIQQEGKIVMLTEAGFAPYEYIKDNEIVGVDVDIANEIAKDLGVELEVVDMDFDGIVEAVKSGKGAFGAAGMSINEERKKQVDFSIEYTKSYQYVVVLKDSEITQNDQINGKVVGVQLGTLGDLIATEDYDCKEVKQYKKFLEAVEELKTGRIDAIVMDQLPAEKIIQANPELKMLDTAIAEDSYAFCVKKGNDSLLQAINNTMQRLMDEGKIEEYTLNHME